MRNIKLEQHLDKDEHWPNIATVRVRKKQSAMSIPVRATQAQAEAIIQSWHDVAILQVTPPISIYFGFIIGDHAQCLNMPVETQQGKFGVHVGDKDVIFFVFAEDINTQLKLELVEITDITDPRYSELPLY